MVDGNTSQPKILIQTPLTHDILGFWVVKAAIAEFPGAVLEDDVANQVYPQAVNAVGSRDTFVGRIDRKSVV